MPPLGYRRTTPVPTNESGVMRAVPDGRAARGVLRSLALLVDRMGTLGGAREGALEPAAAAAVRDALRQLTARIREAAVRCDIADGQFVLNGDPVDRGLTRDDPLLGTLLFRCLSHGVGAITVRQGAAPAELLTLASFLARPRSPGGGDPSRGTPTDALSDTPTSMSVIGVPPTRELLRSWSVLVTPGDAAAAHPLPASTPAAGTPAVTHDVRSDGAGDAPSSLPGEGPAHTAALARLTAAHDDAAATKAVDTLVELVDQAEFRGEARVLEYIAGQAVTRLHEVGGGGGRLALERLLRRLQHRSGLELLARRLPFATDRTPLLALLSRAGETAVDILVRRLVEVDDTAARRAYFDCIVQLDIASPALFDLVRDTRWYVVRNAVALLGEMGVEHADMAILPLLQHDDDRIRIAAARALVRLGTAKALQGLHAAIEDRSPEVRRIAAVSYGLTPGTTGMVRPPAVRLAMALEKETDEDVALEMLAALGKLGSADAIQRLLRIALPQPQTGDFAEPPREAWLRIAALEALVKARGNAVMPHVEALIGDADQEVAQAAYRLRG